ncbi:MAG: DUF421 domain-containing protein [Eubacteriales bacterium]|nr:DUF421 domain-containing protein [Eubacteriales bacterium]
MLIPLIRTLILYFLVVTAIRIMGKRQIGEMQPSELVVAIMISDLASIPMQEVNIPLVSGIVPVLTLLVAEVFMSFICLKSVKFRRIYTGEPSIIIYEGKVLEKELKKLRFSLSDLIEQLRISGCNGIGDVQAAVLETNGQLSVYKKAQPVTCDDLNIQRKGTVNIPFLLVMDGDVDHKELERAGKDEKWLNNMLKRHGEEDISNVFIAELSPDGSLFLQRKSENK